jgi:hypothetical protein
VKQSYPAGTVIEKVTDENGVILVIDGKKYEETRDLDILKKHGWVEPYSASAEKTLKAEHEKTLVKAQPKIVQEEEESIKIKNHKPMKIIQSDEDLMNETIDISHTKPAPKKAYDKNAPMEVIRGDESDVERIARLQTEIPKMPIVEGDESFGIEDASKPALNAGKVKVLTAAEHAAKRAEALKNAGTANPAISAAKRGRGRPKKVATVAAPKEISDDSLNVVTDESL